MSRDSSLVQRPAVELIPERTLAQMERDGWTPTQVRALIASYRELARDYELTRAVLEMPPKHLRQAHRDLSARMEVKQMLDMLGVCDPAKRDHAYDLVEKELRELSEKELLGKTVIEALDLAKSKHWQPVPEAAEGKANV